MLEATFVCEVATLASSQTRFSLLRSDARDITLHSWPHGEKILSSTKRALTAVAALVCLAGLAGAIYFHRLRQPLPSSNGAPAPDILTLLPTDAPAIAYIDVSALRKLQNSPLSALLALTSGSHDGRQARDSHDREYARFVRGTGFDYTRDLDQVALAFWPNDLARARNAAGGNPALAIADGRFDQRKIIAYAARLGGKMESVGPRPRCTVPGYPAVSFEFLSPSRIAIASGRTSRDLLNLAVRSGRDPAVQARINRVARAAIFGVARTDHLSNTFYSNFGSSPQLEHFVRSIHELSLAGQPEGDDIHLALDAECDSLTNAIEISTLLDGFRLVGSMTLADPKMRAQLQTTPEQTAFLVALIRQANISHQDRWVRISLDVTPAMLGKNSHPARENRTSP
jgi:hypothetical protein